MRRAPSPLLTAPAAAAPLLTAAATAAPAALPPPPPRAAAAARARTAAASAACRRAHRPLRRSYVFRVATKDMTYAQQLKDYENAVIQKRFEELNTDEVGALMTEIYPEGDPRAEGAAASATASKPE